MHFCLRMPALLLWLAGLVTLLLWRSVSLASETEALPHDLLEEGLPKLFGSPHRLHANSAADPGGRHRHEIRGAERAKTRSEDPAVIPLPVEMTCLSATEGGGEFLLGTNTVLFTPSSSAVLRQAFGHLWPQLFGWQLKEVKNRTPGRIELQEHFTKLPAEGYMLDISGEAGDSVITIGVATVSRNASLLHALQTLRQLLPAVAYADSSRSSQPWRLPACSIRDWPRYGWRGMMLDVARHFFDVGQVKRLLDLMSMHKFNVLHLHLTDDQGWRVEVQGRPELVEVGATRGTSLNNPLGDGNGERIYNGTPYSQPRFFSKAQVREIVAYAGELNIEVVPEVDVPAHAAALIIAAQSEGRELGVVELHEGCADRQGSERIARPPNCMGGTHGILIPTEEALAYVRGAIQEVVDLFPGRYFHLGGDEADLFRDSVYYSSDVAQQLMEALEVGSPAALQGHVVDEVHRFLRAHNKVGISWDETHFSLEDYSPPKDLLVMWWRDWSPEASWDVVQAMGHRLILAPASKMYLDIYQLEPHTASRHRVQEGTVTLWDTYSVSKLEAPGILGVHACLWSEHLESQEVLDYQMFPRAAAAAEAGWTSARLVDFDDFLRRWHGGHKDRLAALGVAYYDGSYTGPKVEPELFG